MRDISHVDTNFAVKTAIDKPDIRFYSADEAPFCVYGLIRENGKYRRMPEKIARSVNDGVYALHACTAGGRVRFRTNSSYVAIHAEMENVRKMPHFALTGSVGFDLYVGDLYMKTFVPPFGVTEGFEGTADFGTEEMREITVHFPLYSDVKTLYIGLSDRAALEPPTPYRGEKPVVYYGSSITQGGCASRPGMAYQNILSRRLFCDHVNLGFSGSAKAEDEIAAYIKDLSMSLFVYDYDHNAPTVEYLRQTHEKMFKTIRAAQPTLPILMLSRPKHVLTDGETERRGIVETTYKNALAAGDQNVYFLDGAALTALCKDDGTVDGAHPTDFGFASMADAVERVIRENRLLPLV